MGSDGPRDWTRSSLPLDDELVELGLPLPPGRGERQLLAPCLLDPSRTLGSGLQASASPGNLCYPARNATVSSSQHLSCFIWGTVVWTRAPICSVQTSQKTGRAD